MRFMRAHTVFGIGPLSALLMALATIFASGEVPAQAAAADVAERALEAADQNGGLIVHIGCKNPKLTAALDAGENWIVRGLDTDPANVQKARAYIRKHASYGRLSAAKFDGNHLPYADNMVNLIVARNMGDVSVDEAMRALAPGGILYTKHGNEWDKAIKPRPQNIDEWTHYLHDSTGNPVADDDVVGPPRRLQWTANARHGRSHEHTPSTSGVVSANGRIFYIHDDGPIAAVHMPPQWHAVARDAFNGTLLWKRRIPKWCSQLMIWSWVPRPINRRIVAVGDRVFITLGFHAPVSVLDAATGETLNVYDGTRGTEEIVYHRGVLLLTVREVTEKRVSALQKLLKIGRQDDSPLYARKTNKPVVKEFRKAERQTETSIKAVDADTGELLWEKHGEQTDGLRPLTLCADKGRVSYRRNGKLACFQLRTGQKLWDAPKAPLRMMCNGKIICADKKTVELLSAETGKTLWARQCAAERSTWRAHVRDAFIAGGALWIGGFKAGVGGSYVAVKRDLKTGRKLSKIVVEDPGHHHRCYLNKATNNYILAGRRGTEFLDLDTGDVLWHSWARGVCRYGVMPCNGLLYAPPHACGCYTEVKLEGFNALATGDTRIPATISDGERLNRGPAYDSPAADETTSDQSWPTYRSDARRSCSVATSVGTKLKRVWRADLGGKLTAPTVAAGRVFAARKHKHRVCALDADSGRQIWQFTAGGRVDTPPTVHNGRALFGSRDGSVYSLRTTDGKLAWRFQAARNHRNIIVRGQLESAWPTAGSVLADDDGAYVLAGRSSYLDGGMDLYRLDPATGDVLSKKLIHSPDPETGQQPKQLQAWHLPGSRADILSADDEHVYLRTMAFDRKTAEQQDADPHLFTVTDFLDDTWFNRSYWIFGTQPAPKSANRGGGKGLTYGRLLAFDDSTVYGYGRQRLHWSNALQDGAYRLFAVNRSNKEQRWEQSVPVHVRTMVLAGDVLFAAGTRPNGDVDWWHPDESRTGLLVALSADDGTILSKYSLDSCPIFDGMAAAGGRLYISLTDGNIVCMAAPEG